ncbi:hypothetical protein MVEN_01321200 [Mycena venus]|uniref:Auxin efflux carrier n=1 Tax=Mycena venus TaxID=2733690 RepID=A0A8H7CTU3_9AGAR|nr:hypothetical protein MVEN_01321200 [Mycena venus]
MDDCIPVSMVSEDGPFLPLLLTVFTAIFEVFLLCLAGYILAGCGILDKRTQKQLNRLNVSLFTPSLLFSKVAFFLSPEKLKELWIIPIFFVTVTLVSMSVSFLLGWIFRLKRSQRNFAMAASMFMNSNSLPIALMQSLVVTVPGLKWGHADNKNAMMGRALTYLVLYSTLGMVLRWSYGVRLLGQADPETEAGVADDENETSPLLGDRFSADEGTFRQTSSAYNDPVPHISAEAAPPPLLHPEHERRRSRFYNSFPNPPNQSLVQLPSGSTGWRRTRQRLYRAWVALNEFMTAPLWAALASLVVACVQPLQHALDDHLRPPITSAGNCSIPLTLVVLGGYFHPAPPEKVATNRHANRYADGRRSKNTASFLESVRERTGETSSTTPRPGETKTVVIALASRMVLTPFLLLPLMALCARFGFHAVFDDPVFIVSNVLLMSSPPALTLAQITQTTSGDAFERLISRTIFWAYCVVTPPLTIVYVIIGLTLSKL